jgi:SpoVK/Ycf46/Vps4 family AAA+-type ATPase
VAEHVRVNRINKRGGRVYGGGSTAHGCILLYGPSGCGKTYFLKSTANEFKLANEFISCHRLKEQFKEGIKTQLYFKKLFGRARESAPSMIILDDIDEITGQFTGFKNQKGRISIATRAG